MEFDWTTFVLELLNFLVLVWLLKHFFYQPVLAVLDARKQAVHSQAAQAAVATRDAEALKKEYETRLQSWQQERERARQALKEEIDQERARRFDALKKELADENAKVQARRVAHTAQREAQLVRRASAQAFVDVAAMLARLADPALTIRIVAIVIEDLAALPQEQRTALHDAAASLDSGASVTVASAHKLDPATRSKLEASLEQAVEQKLHVEFVERPDLIAGVRIAIGDRLVQANLAEELAFFRRSSEDTENDAHA